MSERSKPSGFEDTMRDFWATRPVRPKVGRKLGGVSAAIGLRYGIDPVLVRVAFVVAACYGGAGILLYLLGALLFPREDDQGRRHPTSMPVAAVLVLLMLPATAFAQHMTGFLGVALGLLGLFLLHRSHGDRVQPVTAPAAAPAAPPTTAPTAPVRPTGDNVWVYPSETQQAPPSWDPLGAAPFAWDLPEPAPEEPPPPPRRNRRWITLSTLLVAAGVAVLLHASGIAAPVVVACALGVLGLGMVLGAFLRGGRGLIAVAIPVGAFALLVSSATLPDQLEGIGDHSASPTTPEALAPRYETGMGTVQLDLEDLVLPPDRMLRTEVHVAIGDVVVWLPPDMDVVTTCSAGTGSVQCLDRRFEGQGVHRTHHDWGADGEGGGRLVLDLSVGTGNVEVHRG
ncbi:PspC domain-containing protein [Saccharopolyspora sp. CA-218241]|uniref:PspC domain-containing protein n=1 Tax=Saccharopolyspora sp. CA-218241 TaxID=3240027 RepID=UPI003D9559E4